VQRLTHRLAHEHPCEILVEVPGHRVIQLDLRQRGRHGTVSFRGLAGCTSRLESGGSNDAVRRKAHGMETGARKSGYGWELCDRLPWGGPDAGRVRVAQRREAGHFDQTGATPDPLVPAAPGRVLRPGHPGAG